MKKLLPAVCLLALLLSVPAAWGESADPALPYADSDIDLDLADMSGTVVYAQIWQILSDYRTYEGKIIRIKGWYDVFQDADTGAVYHSCIIPDATACCAQGIEFVWAGEHLFPDDYAEPGTGVTVTGRFESYMEGEYLYVHLNHAEVIWETEGNAE